MPLKLTDTLDELHAEATAIGACQPGLDDSAKWKGQGYTIADYIQLSTDDLTYSTKYNYYLLIEAIENVLSVDKNVKEGLLDSLMERDPSKVVALYEMYKPMFSGANITKLITGLRARKLNRIADLIESQQ